MSEQSLSEQTFNGTEEFHSETMKFRLVTPTLIRISEKGMENISAGVLLEPREARDLRDWLNKVLP